MGEEGRLEFLGCPSTILFSTMGVFSFVILKVDILAKWLSPAVGGKKNSLISSDLYKAPCRMTCRFYTRGYSGTW